MEEWFKWKNLYKQEDLSLNPNPTKKKIKKSPTKGATQTTELCLTGLVFKIHVWKGLVPPAQPGAVLAMWGVPLS
jgi:hypothetical protein